MHAAFGRVGQQRLHVAAAHVLADDVRLALVLADVVHGHNVWMPAEATHRLGLALDPLATVHIEPFRLDHGERARAWFAGHAAASG